MAGMIELHRFDPDHQFPRYHVSWNAIRNLDNSPSLFQADFAIWGKWLRQPRTVFRQSQQAKAVMLCHLAGFLLVSRTGSSDETRFRSVVAMG
jgi:hypothetical protein